MSDEQNLTEKRVMPDWRDSQLYVMEALKEVRENVKAIRETQIKHDKEILQLKWKNGILGLIGGLLSSVGFKISGI